MADKKVTIVEKYGMVEAFVKENGAPEWMAQFLAERAEKHAHKAENRKPTKTQVANEALKERIVAVLTEADEPMTVTAILNTDVEAFVNAPKVTALVTALVKEGKVVRETDKKKVYFTAVK